MPFLSTDQRKRAIRQHQKVIRLLDVDEKALTERLEMVRELKRCSQHAIYQIEAAEKGEFDIDIVQFVDDCAITTMMNGITHYPVVIALAPANVIRG